MISVTSCKGVHFSTGGSNIQFFERKRNRFVQCHALPSDKSSLELGSAQLSTGSRKRRLDDLALRLAVPQRRGTIYPVGRRIHLPNSPYREFLALWRQSLGNWPSAQDNYRRHLVDEYGSAMTVSPVTQQTSSEDSALLRYGFVIACLIAAWLIEALLRLQPAAILHSPVIMTGGFYSLQAVYQDVPRMTDAFRTGLRSTASGVHSRSALYGT